MSLKLGELCAGYGGLGMAVEEVFNAETAWFSEYEEAPSRILAHHWPTVPNHGDMTKIDWAAIEPVDIISGGTPCQDLSAAGRRAGMTEGTRSNLWVQMREAIAIQRPRYVVWENVRGAYSATANSDLEHCPRCMGDAGDGRAVLRALGRVLGDLSDLGFDAEWRGLRAADVGACHGRFRVFVLAANRDDTGRGKQRRTIAIQQEHTATEYPRADARGSAPTADALRIGSRGGAAIASNGGIAGADFAAHGAYHRPGKSGAAAPAEVTADAGSELQRGSNDAVSGREDLSDTIRSGCHRGARATGREAGRGAASEWSSEGVEWGAYEPAIRRWERTVGRAAPRPTEPTGRNNGHRLSPKFTEWMMGLPEGWVTDPAIGISRNEQLKACGNGVVPQQAMAALRDMLAAFNLEETA